MKKLGRPVTGKAKTITAFRLDAVTRKSLEVMAHLENRSQGVITAQAIEEYFLKYHEAQLEAVLTAIENHDQA